MMSSYLSIRGTVENPQTWEGYIAIIIIIIMLFIKEVLIKQLIEHFFVLMKQIEN